MIVTIPLFLFLTIGTISDIRKHTIPIMLFILFGVTGLVISITVGQVRSGAIVDWVFGIILGAVFIAISLISEKKLGMGDAFAILVTGVYLGGSNSALAVLYAMMITTLFSITILIMRKGSRKTELPFMPFLLTGCLVQQIGNVI